MARRCSSSFGIDFTSGDDTFSLYVNPTPGDPQPAAADATLTFDLGSQNGLALNTGNGAQVSFDEIRIGETFADVTPLVPEPASLILLGLAGLVAAGSRPGGFGSRCEGAVFGHLRVKPNAKDDRDCDGR